MGHDPSSSAPQPFDRVLLPHPSSVGAARGLVRELLNGADRNDLLDDAVLLISEIVTNALIHAGSTIRVRGRVDEQGIRVDVGDASPHQPMLRGYADTAGTGRGLALLVDLVDDWGVVPDEVGKTVWFELGGRSRHEARQHDEAASRGFLDKSAPPARYPTPMTEPAAPDATVDVQFLMMPLLLHAAWREHAETLLRDYLLASLHLDTEAGTGSRSAAEDPIQVHADATDAMTLLEEQVPVANIDMEPAKLMAGATEPGVTSPQLWVKVPQTSVPHFVTLERALERALGLMSSHQRLAPRTQPEIQAFRRWVCREVADQSTGTPAKPWSMSRETAESMTTRTDNLDVDDIAASSENLIAADDTNQILAVSASAAELLGYATAEDLAGQRLVDIIPTRFRQAHIAGFTLHHLVGRSPLLGREVEVPALRRDGTEINIRLEITSRSAPDGVALFVARIGLANS